MFYVAWSFLLGDCHQVIAEEEEKIECVEVVSDEQFSWELYLAFWSSACYTALSPCAAAMAVSKSDDRVLDLIFDPNRQELGFGEEEDENVSEESKEVAESPQVDSVEALAEAKRLELSGIEAAEKGGLDEAISLFDRAVEAAPHYASAFNNRAQGKRMKGDPEGAMEDLNKAIDLCGSRGKVAEQAYVQRAMIRRLKGDDDGAFQDFRIAAALGSAFAKAEAVRLNPYAAMCNQMLREVIGKLQRGEE